MTIFFKYITSEQFNVGECRHFFAPKMGEDDYQNIRLLEDNVAMLKGTSVPVPETSSKLPPGNFTAKFTSYSRIDGYPIFVVVDRDI